MRCTGACCERIEISVPRSTLRAWLDADDYSRRPVDVAQRAEHALIWTLLQPLPGEPVNSRSALHRCRALTPTGCALTYAERPEMCQRFPSNGHRCVQCGAASDAEARGVALQTAMRPSTAATGR